MKWLFHWRVSMIDKRCPKCNEVMECYIFYDTKHKEFMINYTCLNCKYLEIEPVSKSLKMQVNY